MKMQEQIKNRRKELNLSLQEVGDRMGVSRQTISKYETGVITNIPYDSIIALAKALNCDPSYLMGWAKNPNGDEIMPNSGKSSLAENSEHLAEYLKHLPKEAVKEAESYMQFLISKYKSG